ncbi:MAG: hypothetical protein HYZ47_01685 [Simkania negevensis]|nr:hypothetical protein [Simkania negevensis]
MRPSYQELKSELEKTQSNLVITQDALRKALVLIKSLKEQVEEKNSTSPKEESLSKIAK